MVTSDPISDMLTRIRNGYMARNATVAVSWSKMKESLAGILVESKYLSGVKVVDHDLILTLRYNGKDPAITEINRISKPSLRVYTGKNKLPRVLGGMGVAIMSTPQGLMTNRQAYKKGLGGEVICELW